MQLTMAMGLRYEPGAGVSLLTDFKHGQREESARPDQRVIEANGPVIDAEVVREVDERREGVVVNSSAIRHFDYLVYDRYADTVALPLIGTRLDCMI